MKLTVYILLSLLAFTSCGLLGGSNSEDGPPRTIVFSAQDNDGAFQIYSMREDGSGLKQLTDGEYSSTEPAWSPDGSRIAYSRSTGSTAGEALWVMDADGSNKQPLVTSPRTGSPQLGNRPAWSPDGTKLAFDLCLNCEAGGLNYEIYVADLQTGAIDTLTHHPVEDSHPTWSPDGQRIAFASNRDYFDADKLRFRKDLYVINANGSSLQRLTEKGITRDPVWNPDNNNIIGFGSNVRSKLGLFQVDISTEEIRSIEENFTGIFLLVPMAWSRDGKKILIIARDQSTSEYFSMYIVNTENGQSRSIPYKAKIIIGADWFVPVGN